MTTNEEQVVSMNDYLIVQTNATNLTKQNFTLKNNLKMAKQEFDKLNEDFSELSIAHEALKVNYDSLKEMHLSSNSSQVVSPNAHLTNKCQDLEKTVHSLKQTIETLKLEKTNEWIRANARQADVEFLTNKMKDFRPNCEKHERQISDLNSTCFLKGVEIETLQKQVEDLKANVLFYQEKIYKIEQNPLLNFTAYYNKSKIDRSELLFGLGYENPAHLEKAQKEDLGPLYDEKCLRLGMIQEFVRPSEDDFESDDVERPKPIPIDYVAVNDSYKTTHKRTIYELEEIDNISIPENDSQKVCINQVQQRFYIPTTILEKEIEGLKQKIESLQQVIEHLKTQDQSPKVNETTPIKVIHDLTSDDCSTPFNMNEISNKDLQGDSISPQEIQDMSTTMLSSFFQIEEKVEALKAKHLASVKKILSFETPVNTPVDQNKVTLEQKIEIPTDLKAKAKALIEKMMNKTVFKNEVQTKDKQFSYPDLSVEELDKFLETDHVFAPEVEKELEKLSPKKDKPKKESKSKIAPTSFYSPKSQHASAVKGKQTTSHTSPVSRTSTSKVIFTSRFLPKKTKTCQVFLKKDTSDGKTGFRDQYGWFTVSKKQNNKNQVDDKSPVRRNWIAKDTKKKFSEKKLAKQLSVKTPKSSTVISKPLIIDSNGIVMNLKNKPLVRKPHLYSLIDSTNPKGPIQRWVPRKP